MNLRILYTQISKLSDLFTFTHCQLILAHLHLQTDLLLSVCIYTVYLAFTTVKCSNLGLKFIFLLFSSF